MLRALGLVLVFALVGCGDDSSRDRTELDLAPVSSGGESSNAPEPVCESGRAVECPCIGGKVGVQICTDDGSKWDACQCEDAVTPKPQRPPSEVCIKRLDYRLVGAQACPAGKPVAYWADGCPDEYLASGVCAPNGDDSFTCCPDL